MLKFEKEQKVSQIGNVKIGGQPGENPIVSVSYTHLTLPTTPYV